MVTGTDFLRSLPQHAGQERERAILDAVRNGAQVPPKWAAIFAEKDDHALVVYVMSDALRIGTPQDSFRINASARTAQQIADVTGCLLPTTRLCDLIWEQAAVRIAPSIGGAGADMADTARMLAHSASVERLIQGRPGLVENVGKNWVLTNKLVGHPGRAANYGWFDTSAPYSSGPNGHGKHRLWQPLGLAHDLNHVDYSQTVRLVHPRCLLDGRVAAIANVLRDARLASLLSDEGPLPVRQPGVELVAGLRAA
jgi:hypothetical protein